MVASCWWQISTLTPRLTLWVSLFLRKPRWNCLFLGWKIGRWGSSVLGGGRWDRLIQLQQIEQKRLPGLDSCLRLSEVKFFSYSRAHLVNNLKTPKDYKILSLMNMLIKKTCEHIDQSLIDGVKIFLKKRRKWKKLSKKRKWKTFLKKEKVNFQRGGFSTGADGTTRQRKTQQGWIFS